jgi:CheY-like chemotaxis protein
MTTRDDTIATRPVVLVVEDNEVGLRRRAGLLADAGCTPIPVRSRDEALRELRTSPGVDMVLTDIRLVDRDGDRSGVELARSIKDLDRDLPVIGYSAHFSDDDDLGSDKALFAGTHIKGRMTYRDILQTIEDCRRRAMDYRLMRTRRALAALEVLRRRHECSVSEGDMIVALAPGGAGTRPIAPALEQAGYILRLIDIGVSGFERPIVVWLLATGSVVEAEVYGHPALYADGDDEQSATEHLIELMRLYAAELRVSPGRLAGPARDLGRFLEHVLGRGVA